MDKAGLKQSDMATLIIVVAISLIIAFLIGNTLINTPQSRSVKVEIAQPISDVLPVPDEGIYAEGYINPTELIEIGNSNNSNPFGNQTN